VVTSSWLMCGNGGLLRHSPNVTGNALEIEEIFRDAGLPESVFRTVVVAEPDSPRVNPGDCSQTARP